MKTLLESASKAYYDGNPFLTNEQYDSLERIYGQIISGNGDVPHAFRMYSLQKKYVGDDLPNLKSYIKSPKLDGAAVSILYVDGDLCHALTRGDGFKGRDITDKLARLGLPEMVNVNGMVQVTGEVVCKSTVPNPRNYVSGALNLKGMEEFVTKSNEGELKFIAYEIQTVENRRGFKDTYLEDLEFMEKLGFWTVRQLKTDEGFAYYSMPVKYLTDGIVYRLNDNKEFNTLGHTSKFPRGAFALKENAEAVHTVLKDVIWQTGKSGKVSPVAILEPVKIGDAMVSRATLNNIDFIKALGLYIGCKVGIVRSGEIIPCVVSLVE